MDILLYLSTGVIAGILSGLLGIGGGLVTVPALFFLFRYLDFPSHSTMHMAIGTSLASMIFNTLASALSYARKNNVLWDLFKSMLPGLVAGSLIGALVAEFLTTRILATIFGLVACIIGASFLHSYTQKISAHLPRRGVLGIYGFSIAFSSNILGLGGGTFTVPTLLFHHVPERKAIGTSAVIGFLIAFLGTLFYLFVETPQKALPYTLGFIYLPAFVYLSLASFFTAFFGVYLAHKISPRNLRRIFGCALILVGISMFIL